MSQYLGDISAYALAVSQGYTGTEEEYAELMASYATVGQTAVTAAQTATTKASEAATSATTATTKASEATTAATTATTKAGEASTSASTATSAKDTAVSASQTATTKATEATTAAATATIAKTDAVAANTAAQSAKTAAQTAQTGAETAAASVQSSAAQIQTNADDISELKEDLTNNLSFFDENPIRKNIQMTVGKYISNSGVITAGGNQLSISDYIPINAFVNKIIAEKYNANITTLMYAVNFYDASKAWLGGKNPESGNQITAVSKEDFPEGTAYIILGNYDTQSTPTHDQVYLTVYEFVINDRVAELENNMPTIDKSVLNADIFTDKTVTTNKNINYSTGNADNNASFAASAVYTPVKPNTTYHVMRNNNKLHGTGNVAFYNASKQYISGQQSNWTDWTTPNGAYYVRFSVYYGSYTADTFSFDGVAIVEGSVATALNDLSAFTSAQYSPLYGKKWIGIGDSLTEVNLRADLRYWNYIVQPYKMTFVNMGVGGSGYINRQNENKAFYQRVASIPTDADIITVFGGVNDCLLASADIGDPTDTGTTTWCGCVNELIDTIRSLYSFAPLGIISPLPCDWIDPNNESSYDSQLPSDTTCRMSQFVDKLKTICALRGVPFLDLFHTSGMTPEDSAFCAKYYSCGDARTGDGLHPNSEGHKLFYRKIEKFIETLL